MDVYRLELSHHAPAGSWVLRLHYRQLARPAGDLPARVLADAWDQRILEEYRSMLSNRVRFGGLRVWRHDPPRGIPWFYPYYDNGGLKLAEPCAPPVAMRIWLQTDDARARRPGFLHLRGLPREYSDVDVWVKTRTPDPWPGFRDALTEPLTDPTGAGGLWELVYRSRQAGLPPSVLGPWFAVRTMEIEPKIVSIRRPETADQIVSELPEPPG